MNEFKARLDSILVHHDDVQQQLSFMDKYNTPEYAALTQEYAELEPITVLIRRLFAEAHKLDETERIASCESDVEIKEMANEEIPHIKENIKKLEHDIKVMLLPKDIDDEKNAIVEIRAGTGGDEAGLFAADLLRMYELYAELHGWRVEVLEFSESGIGSIKTACVSIIGKGVFSRMKFESGVHRVQRVPETESAGRIHTSTATVAVLPEVEDVDIEIDEKDLKIDTYRSSGAGGQHVNKTDSAVRITHIPTGTVVAVQDERSQYKNKAKAMKILRSKIYEHERMKQNEQRSGDRRSQIGTGDRSERIRTYNFPQGRVTDHRINLTLYKIDKIMNGTSLDEIIDKLIETDQIEKIKGSE